MPVNPTYPGVYIEEVPSGVRTIMGVATSITAFIGRAARGPVNDPVRVQSYSDYTRTFGGLWEKSTMSYAVQQYFLNGGTDAVVVRVAKDATAATLTLDEVLDLKAANPGSWGSNLEVLVDHDTKDKDEADHSLFNLTIREVKDGRTIGEEVYRNLSHDSEDAMYVGAILNQRSTLVCVPDDGSIGRPLESTDNDGDGEIDPETVDTLGSDGTPVGFAQIADPGLEAERQGIWALESTDLFNMLCIPPFDRTVDTDTATWTAALAYCKKRRAMLIVDPPSHGVAGWTSPVHVTDEDTGVDTLGLRDENAVIFFPQVVVSDPLRENRLESFAPCGIAAGIFARTDGARGVWKAPAGLDATLVGVKKLAYKMTDGENGQLNPLGVNCLRNFPVVGNVIWGARTLEGADRLASEWKYTPVRRLALFLEESLFRGTQWVVFEPNDEPLWAQIRLNVGAFMHNLFRKGAFQGTSPKDAYFVKCDSETTTQNDINEGIVNILVGFAPLKPAEFVIIKISQIAGDIQT